MQKGKREKTKIKRKQLVMTELLQSSELSFSLLNSSPNPITVINSDTSVEYVNRALEKLTGFSRQELIGSKAPYSWWTKGTLHKTSKEFRKAMRNGARKVEELFQKKSGEQFWVEITSVPVKTNGRFKYYLSNWVDITKRKKAEVELKESEERYRYLFEQSPIGIGLSTVDGKVVAANTAMQAITGYSLAELKKINLADIYENAKERKTLLKHLSRYNCVNNFSVRLKRKGGISYEALLNITRIHALGKNLLQTTCIDITQRKRVEKELVKLNKDLLNTNKKLRQLTLKDPLTSLYNHVYFEDAIEAEFHRAKRFGHPLSVIMLDLDYFKSINEVYGHHFGDLVLKQFARQLKRLVRPYDIVVRYGGEEFVIINSGIDRAGALTLAKRLQDAINLYNFGDKNNAVELKLSVAIVSYPEDNNIAKGMDFIELAEQILNKAKEHGGDCVYTTVDIGKKKTPSSETGKQKNDVKFLTEKIDKLTKKANQSLIESVFAFAKTIKLKDRHTGEHVERAVQYATDIAENLSLTKDEVERIRQASILHDLGKIGIGEKVLLKKGKLTKKEFEEIKKHPQIGVDIIRPIQFLHSIVPLILFHHERWDGKGYPKGLKGEEIPLGARIVAISDVYQALISDRPYRKAFSKKEAVGIIKEGSGTQFDPKIVSSFLKILRKKKNKKI